MKGLMKGLYPVTRTREYLGQGIVFRDCVRVMTVNYGTYAHSEEAHAGIKNVINMNLSQMRHANPEVQIEVFENVTPTPFVSFFLDSGDKFHIDVEGKEQFEILKHIQKVIGKPPQLIAKESAEEAKNPANFGEGYDRKCMCMVEGQVPCSRLPSSTPGSSHPLHGKRINLNPKKYVFGKED